MNQPSPYSQVTINAVLVAPDTKIRELEAEVSRLRQLLDLAAESDREKTARIRRLCSILGVMP